MTIGSFQNLNLDSKSFPPCPSHHFSVEENQYIHVIRFNEDVIPGGNSKTNLKK